MNKSVLISIQPYWLFLIIAKSMGWRYPTRKTVEVRKFFPKDENWDKTVKLYCTKSRSSFNRIPKEYQPLMEKFLGKVIGEFDCNEIEKVTPEKFSSNNEGTCLTPLEITNYGGNKPIYYWHISVLWIYDRPKQLNEFYRPCNIQSCKDCQFWFNNGEYAACESRPERQLKRPPQSWCYVIESSEEMKRYA